MVILTNLFSLPIFLDGKKSMKVYDFDVSSEKVSMHIPIVRFLAGKFVSLNLLQLSLLYRVYTKKVIKRWHVIVSYAV